MQKFGKNILKDIENSKFPKKLNIKKDNLKFIFCQANELENIEGKLEKIKVQNSMHREVVYRIHKGVKLKFSNKFKGYNLIVLRAWNTN